MGFTVLIALIGVGVWAFMVYCEGEVPGIVLNKDIKAIGQKTTFDVTFTDMKSGIRNASVEILQDGKKETLGSLTLSERGVDKETLAISVFPEVLKLHDGTATINVSVTDYSLRKNTRIATFEVVIDTIAPQISTLNSYTYINPGGSGVVVYTLSEDVVRSGVEVNNDFFPSYPVTTGGTPRRTSYFAVPIVDSAQENLKIHVLAEDSAGNSAFVPVSFRLKSKKVRADSMNISQSFLEMKMPEFQNQYKDLTGTGLVEAFSYVNTQIRSQDQSTIETICKNTSPEQLWEGTFLRMKNAAPMASFGDRRTYYYNGKEISKSVHMGVDLASTRGASVLASNAGTVAFTGRIGIYGNAVIIDHGMGIFSLYGHLSSINTKKDQAVKKGEEIGRTGMTGMAGGDHLHFSVLVGGKFVNPVEWWDPHWIQDNITKKLSGEG
ncbi:MAG: M23 family metallopeptidase [Syntrophales bacterium]|nr:M23 family metallopeptidase [Syntrophales bacterium]